MALLLLLLVMLGKSVEGGSEGECVMEKMDYCSQCTRWESGEEEKGVVVWWVMLRKGMRRRKEERGKEREESKKRKEMSHFEVHLILKESIRIGRRCNEDAVVEEKDLSWFVLHCVVGNVYAHTQVTGSVHQQRRLTTREC